MKPEIFSFPKTVAEAASELKKSGAVALAGGTQLVRNLPAETRRLVCLRELPLSYVKADKRYLRIGSGTTFSQLLASPLAKKWAGGMLYDAAIRVSSRMVRNMGTVGGNIVRPFPANHFMPALLALDAQISVCEGGKTVRRPVGEIFGEKFFHTLGRKSLLVEILIPAETKNRKAAFGKFAKAETMWDSYALTAVSLHMRAGKCAAARVAVGSAIARAARFERAEKLLTGEKITPQLARKAGAAAAEDISHFTPIEASAEYKKSVLPVFVERTILKALELQK